MKLDNGLRHLCARLVDLLIGDLKALRNLRNVAYDSVAILRRRVSLHSGLAGLVHAIDSRTQHFDQVCLLAQPTRPEGHRGIEGYRDHDKDHREQTDNNRSKLSEASQDRIDIKQNEHDYSPLAIASNCCLRRSSARLAMRPLPKKTRIICCPATTPATTRTLGATAISRVRRAVEPIVETVWPAVVAVSLTIPIVSCTEESNGFISSRTVVIVRTSMIIE